MSKFKIQGVLLALPDPLRRAWTRDIISGGKETAKRFANVHFHCIVSTLKKISKMSMLPAPWKISADAHASDIVVSPDILRWF